MTYSYLTCRSYSVCGGVQDQTMAELTAKTRRVIEWVKATPAAAKANAVLLSAWNEHDEGHWICPSLRNGTQKLEAILAAVKPPSPTPRRGGRAR